jgi:NodT family efflux transporter outer membrane factor (OMF) lipoprotein
MVGPDYRTPETAMPGQFLEGKEAKGDSAPDSALCHWWKQFQDPLLDSLIAEAVRANYSFRIAVEQISQARAQYRIQASYLWPEIDLNAEAVRSRNSQNFFTSSGGSASSTGSATGSILPTFQNFFQIGLDAIYEFDLFGKYRRSKNAAYRLWEASKENAQDILISVVSEVAVSYVNICALQQLIALTVGKIEADNEELALTQVLFDAGLASEIQVETIRATLESDSSQLPVLYTSLKQTIYGLAVLLGREPEGLVSTFQTAHSIPQGTDRIPLGLPSDLLRRRPDIKRAERQIAAATEQIGVAVADLFPRVTLTGITFSGGQLAGSGYGYESGSLNTWFKPSSRAWSIGPAIRWDLIDFGKTRANIRVQNSLQKQALLTYEQTVMASLQDVEGALVAYFQEQKRRDHFKEQADALLSSLELTQDLFQAGLADAQQVLDGRKALIEAQSSLVASEQALTGDLIAVYKALGGNWECSYTP